MANLKPECSAVQDIVFEQFARLELVRILEAGCGSNSAFEYKDNAYVVGLDLSERQLQRNDRLNEKHQGDVQTYVFPRACFDMIICWNVLEHLSQPENALENFARWLAPGGILILALPNVLSAIGLATKFLPHWFHVWWYRHILHIANAGTDDHGPFKTFLRLSISLPSLIKYAEQHRLSVRFVKVYGSKSRRGKGGQLRFLYRLACIPVEVVTLRSISAFNEAIMLVLEK